MKFTRPHQRQDWIRFQLSKLAAARIRENPEIVEIGLQHIRRWMENGTGEINSALEPAWSGRN